MKRAGELIERIANADNLRLAFWKASRGKRAKAEVLRFRADLDARLRILREKLFSASVAWGPYRTFKVYDPKERMICVAPFRDRVAQHAIINVVEPHFESYQIHDSYACRRGKGLDGAIARAVCFSRRGDWYLKMDVRKYFDSIHHEVLKRSAAAAGSRTPCCWPFWTASSTATRRRRAGAYRSGTSPASSLPITTWPSSIIT